MASIEVEIGDYVLYKEANCIKAGKVSEISPSGNYVRVLAGIYKWIETKTGKTYRGVVDKGYCYCIEGTPDDICILKSSVKRVWEE